MTDPQIVCPNCRTEIKLTESLAAPLVAQARRHFEEQLAIKEADFGRRETELKQSQAEVAKAREAIDDRIASRLNTERAAIAATEANKARLAILREISDRGACHAAHRRWPNSPLFDHCAVFASEIAKRIH